MNIQTMRISACLFAVLLLVAALRLPVNFDEAYYWTWSKSLAWHYLDHPPGVAWLLCLSRQIFGDGLLGLRVLSLSLLLATILLLRATLFVLIRDVLSLKRDQAQTLLLVALASAPMFAVGYLPLTPDLLQATWLAAACYTLVRALTVSHDSMWHLLAAWLWTTVVLTKHSSALLAFGLLLVLVVSVEGRRQLRLRHTQMGMLLGGLAIAPWLFSEYHALRPSLWFQWQRVFHTSQGLGFSALPVALGSMLATFGPASAATYFMMLNPRICSRLPLRQKTLLLPGSLLIAVCVVAVALGRAEANWPMPAMVLAWPCVIHYVLTLQPNRQRWFRYISGFCAMLVAVLLLHIIKPFLPISPQKDRTLEGAGFEELGQKAAAALTEHDIKLQLSDRYQTLSMLRYHQGDRYLAEPLGAARESQFHQASLHRLLPGEKAVWVSTRPSPLCTDMRAIGPSTEVWTGHPSRRVERYFVAVFTRSDQPGDAPCWLGK